MWGWWRGRGPAYGLLEARVASRHVCLFACFCLEVVGGSVYTFGVYSGALRDAPLSLRQSDLDWCAFAANLGNFLPVSGEVFQRVGAQRTAIAGGLTVLAGYLGLYIVVSLPPGTAALNFAAAAACCFVWGHGAGYLDTTAVATGSRNFPRHRGRVLGVIKALFGLGSCLLTNIYMAVLFPHKTAFILLLALLCGGTAILLSPLLSAPPEATCLEAESKMVTSASYLHDLSPAEIPVSLRDATAPAEDGAMRDDAQLAANAAWIEARLESIFWVVAGIIGVMLAVSIAQSVAPSGGWKDRAYDIGAAFALLSLAALALTPRGAGPLYVTVPEAPNAPSSAYHAPQSPTGQTVLMESTDVDESGPSMPGLQGSEVAARQTDAMEHAQGLVPVKSLAELLRSHLFWLTFATFFVGFGAGLMLANNAGQIVRSAGGSDADISAMVSLYSLSNGFGRLIMGRIADQLATRSTVSRTILAPATALATAVTHAVLGLASDVVPVLYGAFAMAGLSYGAFWCLSPTLLGDLFGIDILPQAYTLMNSAAMLGSLVFSNLLAAGVYEANADAEGSDCVGAACFRKSFYAVASAALLATATGLGLHRAASRASHRRI